VTRVYPTPWELAELQVSCYCGAPEGEWCRTPKGAYAYWLHTYRYHLVKHIVDPLVAYYEALLARLR